MTDALAFEIRDRSGAAASARAVERLAVEHGFPDGAAHEIALVVRELATNLVKHADGGLLEAAWLHDGGRSGIEIRAVDRGPGLEDPDRAFANGLSTTGSLGYGLGTVNRLMDEVDVSSKHGAGIDSGTQIAARRWLRRDVPPRHPFPVGFGVVTRPHPKARVNGDAFVVKQWGDQAILSVIDGLGHGEMARRASAAARSYIDRHYDQDLERLLLGAHRVCVGGRGVVIGIVRFDVAASRLRFAGVGNIEARLWMPGSHSSLPSVRGVLGARHPKIRVADRDWLADARLVLHSDGLSSRWDWASAPGLTGLPPKEAARAIFEHAAKPDDDATVVVAVHTGSGRDTTGERIP